MKIRPIRFNCSAVQVAIFLAISIVYLAFGVGGCATLSERLASTDDDTRLSAQHKLMDSDDSDKRVALPILVTQLGLDESALRVQAYDTLKQMTFSDGTSGLDAAFADLPLATAAADGLKRYWGLYPAKTRTEILERLAAQTQVDCDSWLWDRLRDPRVSLTAESALGRWLSRRTSALDVARMLDILSNSEPAPSTAKLLWTNASGGPLEPALLDRLVAALQKESLALELREDMGHWLLQSGWPLTDDLRAALAMQHRNPPEFRARLIVTLAATLSNQSYREALTAIALDSTDEQSLRARAAYALASSPKEGTTDVLAQIALGSNEPTGLRKTVFDKLAALSKATARDVALEVIADAASPETLRLSLLDWLDANWRKSMDKPLLALCLADFDSALCAKASDVLARRTHKRQRDLEAARAAQSLRKAESLAELIAVYDAIAPDIFLRMPLNVRRFANAIYELAVADDLILRRSSPQTLATFNATVQTATDCLQRAMAALKAGTLEDDAACRDAADHFRRDSDRLMAAMSPIRDQAIGHVQLAAALSSQIDDSGLKNRFTDLFLNGNELEAGFFIRLWFKSARQQIREILDDNPSYFDTLDKEKPSLTTGKETATITQAH
jgi:hypothetical protein